MLQDTFHIIKEVMNTNKTKILIYAGLAATFYLLPFLIRDTGSAMFVLLIVMPMIAWILSAICCARFGFSPKFSLLVGLLFLPSIFLHYNESAWVYIFGYAAVSLLGQGMALFINRR